ncbi:DUF397 domain-containing protein [Halostreptopolyspora alba]|uniref:DUF397 domain-containing protein n=1 Tax=Halostreptopolyspora alba TaxID=2487137 RepID=A0A3N0EG47_9ACTN|nr:DUF397 domain-containing protein [Nocardiopsaceae bacterium YIM 96095]
MIDHDWSKSSYSQKGASNCVQARSVAARVVDVRDSQYPDHGYLSFDGGEWLVFLADVEAF